MEEKQQASIKKNGRLIYLNLRNGSKIYIKEDEILKFSKDIRLCKDFSNIIDKTATNDFFVKVNYLIYKEDLLSGYSMKFYNDAKTLKQLFNRPLSLKKQDCLKIEEAFNFMTENKFYHRDIHRGNFMITKNGQLLVTDLESLKYYEDFDLKPLNKRMASILSLSYLYGIEVNSILALVRNSSKFLNVNNYELKNYFSELNHENNIKDLLNLISEEDIKYNRKTLKKEAKELKRNPYFRGYYYY